MSDPQDLIDLLDPHLDPAAAAALRERPESAAELRTLWEAGASAWPGVEVSAADFFAFLGRRLDAAAAQAPASLRGDDLYLLCAYLRGTPGASARFEAAYLARATRALGRVRADADEIAEITQSLRLRLLLDRAVDPERRHYVGSGSLASWLCVSAVRELWHLRRARGRADPESEHALESLPTRDEDQELAYLKALYRREFKEAFAEALASLAARDRNVLRYNVLKGLNIDEIGAIYQVHRATIARWIARARKDLLEATHAALLRKIQVQGRDLESIYRLIESQLDVSLRRRLEEDA